jgi:hypothetical protein
MSDRTIRCRCGKCYPAPTFARLSPVRVLDSTEIAPLVVRWPDDTVVDVRACAGCSAPIARLARRA